MENLVDTLHDTDEHPLCMEGKEDDKLAATNESSHNVDVSKCARQCVEGILQNIVNNDNLDDALQINGNVEKSNEIVQSTETLDSKCHAQNVGDNNFTGILQSTVDNCDSKIVVQNEIEDNFQLIEDSSCSEGVQNTVQALLQNVETNSTKVFQSDNVEETRESCEKFQDVMKTTEIDSIVIMKDFTHKVERNSESDIVGETIESCEKSKGTNAIKSNEKDSIEIVKKFTNEVERDSKCDAVEDTNCEKSQEVNVASCTKHDNKEIAEKLTNEGGRDSGGDTVEDTNYEKSQNVNVASCTKHDNNEIAKKLTNEAGRDSEGDIAEKTNCEKSQETDIVSSTERDSNEVVKMLINEVERDGKGDIVKETNCEKSREANVIVSTEKDSIEISKLFTNEVERGSEDDDVKETIYEKPRETNIVLNTEWDSNKIIKALADEMESDIEDDITDDIKCDIDDILRNLSCEDENLPSSESGNENGAFEIARNDVENDIEFAENDIEGDEIDIESGDDVEYDCDSTYYEYIYEDDVEYDENLEYEDYVEYSDEDNKNINGEAKIITRNDNPKALTQNTIENIFQCIENNYNSKAALPDHVEGILKNKKINSKDSLQNTNSYNKNNNAEYNYKKIKFEDVHVEDELEYIIESDCEDDGSSFEDFEFIYEVDGDSDSHDSVEDVKSIEENNPKVEVQSVVQDILQCIEDNFDPKDAVQRTVANIMQSIEDHFDPKDAVQKTLTTIIHSIEDHFDPKDSVQTSINHIVQSIENHFDQRDAVQGTVSNIVQSIEDSSEPKTVVQNVVDGMLQTIEENENSKSALSADHYHENDVIEEIEYYYDDNEAVQYESEVVYEDVYGRVYKESEYVLEEDIENAKYRGSFIFKHELYDSDDDGRFGSTEVHIDHDVQDVKYDCEVHVKNEDFKCNIIDLEDDIMEVDEDGNADIVLVTEFSKKESLVRGIKRQHDDELENVKKLRLEDDETEKLTSLVKNVMNTIMSDKTSSVIRRTYESFLPEIIEICLKLEVQKICDSVRKTATEDWQNQLSEIHGSLQKTRDDFKKCRAIAQSQRGGLLTNGVSPANIPIAQPASAVPITSANNNMQPESELIQVVHVVSQKLEPTPLLPPSGSLQRRSLSIGTKVYAVKFELADVWTPATIIKMMMHDQVPKYEVRFGGNNKKKWLTKKELAYESPPDVRLQSGRRIIALYTPDDNSSRPAFYSGVIAEPVKSTNKYRYLVFFDDSVAQYVTHNNVRLVCEESKLSYENVGPTIKDFIKQYFEKYPERPMLRMQKGQAIRIEYLNEWVVAKVLEIDGSLVYIQYLNNPTQKEWVYRGSKRLYNLLKELENAEQVKQANPTGRTRRHIVNRTARAQPYVEYTGFSESEIVLDSDSEEEVREEPAAAEAGVPRRNVARKSTALPHKPNNVLNINKSPSPVHRHKEGLIETIPVISYTPVTYIPHLCSPSCLQITNVAQSNGKNPLCVPMLMGFERQICRSRKRGIQFTVWYRGPCGRMMRNLHEVTEYLYRTDSSLTIDFFTTDPTLLIYQYFRTTVEETLWSIGDITEGKEAIPIPCVNCLTNESPPHVEYSTKPYPGKGVKLNEDKNFLCGCDCTDNCLDRLKCACQQLTIKAYSKDAHVTDVGYEHRRLREHLVTGIYECNSNCACNSKCVNRVVQHGIKVRLQMFKTEKKGWGIRCIDDIDAGQFICSYAGQLLTDAVADTEGKIIGDEYMAELDHIEVVERMKEGYESDVSVIDIEIDNEDKKEESEDQDDTSSKVSTSSDSPPESAQESDSDYENPLIPLAGRNTTYTTRSKKSDAQKKKSFLDEIEGEEEKEELRSSKVELPDLNKPAEPEFLLRERQVSPETEANISNFSGRKPNFSSKHTVGAKRSTGGANFSNLPRLDESKPKRFKSIRAYFNEEDCYIMDAKTKGNIGRYLNHSCNPNTFVQNVLFDSHDLRFPTVAFFAYSHIKAGTELTWDYNYEVGTVPDKVMICYCEGSSCRGRLL